MKRIPWITVYMDIFYLVSQTCFEKARSFKIIYHTCRLVKIVDLLHHTLPDAQFLSVGVRVLFFTVHDIFVSFINIQDDPHF